MVNIIKKIIEKIYNLFIFDVLTGQGDRHSLNYGIIEGKKIFFSPLFDNEYILSSDSINEGLYSIGIDDNDKESENLLEKFIYNNNYHLIEIIKNKLKIIEEDNILLVFNKLEERTQTEFNKYIKNLIFEKFEINKKIINTTLNRCEKSKSLKYNLKKYDKI